MQLAIVINLLFLAQYVLFRVIKFNMENKMKIKRILISALVILGFTSFSNVANASCGSLVIAEQNWASAELMANVDKVILEEGYGCEVELVPGATMPTFTSMNDKGTPDMNPEQWANAVYEPLKVAVKEKRIFVANGAPITGLGEGWWLTPGSIEKHPELKGMTALQILERPDLFPDKEDPSKGAFVGCPAGWGCQLANANLFVAYEMEKKGWKLIDPGSAAGLDGTISKASDSGKPWFGYYWNPTSMVGKYGLIPVDFGVEFAGRDNWDNCIMKPAGECASPKQTAWTKSEVNSLITKSFKEKAGKGPTKYVEKRTYPGEVMNGMLVYMADNQAKGSDAAVEFLVRYPDVWTKWVPADVADKIRKGIGL
jgi:glycine betaine/proline transport system substrate-binding protein|tara:strand:+ start:1410 stop:2519 length:1110 start_codon:yes stop_codon:yes gene_type:complete